MHKPQCRAVIDRSNASPIADRSRALQSQKDTLSPCTGYALAQMYSGTRSTWAQLHGVNVPQPGTRKKSCGVSCHQLQTAKDVNKISVRSEQLRRLAEPATEPISSRPEPILKTCRVDEEATVLTGGIATKPGVDAHWLPRCVEVGVGRHHCQDVSTCNATLRHTRPATHRAPTGRGCPDRRLGCSTSDRKPSSRSSH